MGVKVQPATIADINFQQSRKRLLSEGKEVELEAFCTRDYTPTLKRSVVLDELHLVCPFASLFTVVPGYGQDKENCQSIGSSK